MISSGYSSISKENILEKTTEFDVLFHYFNINKLPTVISSPLRQDTNPSLGVFTPDGKKVRWYDFAHRESGDLWDLLSGLWAVTYEETLTRVYNDLPFKESSTVFNITKSHSSPHSKSHSDSVLECKVREWKEHDIKYWAEYGISIEWLKYADVYPISHKIITKEGKRYVFGADKHAYAYVERKEGKVTLKIYQPLNKKGYKWCSKHDLSVISLWTKIPKHGEQLVICSSLKDALCFWSNVGIPTLATQGEGYPMSETAIKELKRRYTSIYILFDNDEAGIIDGEKLSKETGFINLVLPDYGEKDISDLYKSLKNKERFKEIMLNLINEKKKTLN